jgi:hypothetical protein
LGAGAGLLVDAAHQRFCVSEPVGVDVVERQLEPAVQLGESAQVGDDVTGELDAAGADERYLRHDRTMTPTRTNAQ